MRKQRTLGSIFVGSKNTTQKITVQAFGQRISPPPGAITIRNYANEIVTEHNSSPTASGVKLGKHFRRPTSYRVFALKVQREEFDYTYLGGSTRNWGLSDTQGGYGTTFKGYHGTKLAGGLRVPDVSDSDLNRVIVECKNKLQNQDLNLLTSLGESIESLHMVSGALTSMAALVARLATQKYRKIDLSKWGHLAGKTDGDIRKFKRSLGPNGAPIQDREFDIPDKVLNHAEQTWLSVMYGILPLVSEVQAFATAAAVALQKEGSHVRALRTRKWDYGLPVSSSPIFEVSGSCTVGAECELYYRVDDPTIARIAAMGLFNPLGVWWELTPYSFVFDWLVPVGTMLQSVTSTVGLTFLSGYTNTGVYSDFTVKSSDHTDSVGKLPTVRYQNRCQKRTTLFTSPIGGFYWKSPFSTNHTISALALIGQLARNMQA